MWGIVAYCRTFGWLGNPVSVMLQATVGSVLIGYLQSVALESIQWCIPIMFAIIADLTTGVNAAQFRGEYISFSTALRRSGNKVLAYTSWILVAVSCGIQFSKNWCCPSMMAIVLFIEGCSIIENILEPKGIQLSWKGILAVIGKKFGADNLDEIITTNDKKKQQNPTDTDA